MRREKRVALTVHLLCLLVLPGYSTAFLPRYKQDEKQLKRKIRLIENQIPAANPQAQTGRKLCVK